MNSNQAIVDRFTDEEALKASEHKFRSLIEHSADAIMVVDENSVPVFASDSLYRIMGQTPEEVLGIRTLNYVHPDDKERLEQHVQNVIDNPGKPISIVYRRIKKDGTVIWCDGVAINFLDDPAIRGIVVNFRDITERVKAEQALRDSENRFRSLIENSSDVIVVADKDMNIVFISDSVLRFTGFKPGEIIGLKSMHFSHPEEKDRVREFINNVKNTPGIPQKIVYRTLKKDGSVIWCERVSTNLLHDPAINGIVSNFRDITEQYKYEQALEASNETLKKTNLELDRFVYSVSHDLRAPLSSILGVIEFAETETDEQSMLELLGMLKSSVKKLDGFVLDILNYSRNARVQLECEKIDFNELVSDIVRDLRFMNAGNSNVAITIDVNEKAILYSDKSRIKMVVSNLLANALRYHDPQKPNPFVNILIQPHDTGIIISIQDNGIGISRDNHEKIFDMFYRASVMSEGTGIGLYIVKETVQKLNGTITLKSEPGIGSDFKVYLPAINNKSQ
jgi:PAS domain S-box-containing protein